MRKLGWLLCLALSVPLGPPLAAQEADDASSGSFSGHFVIGVRSVDIGGAERKYREDIDLDDGPRLFGLRFDFVPEPGFEGFVDRVTFDASNIGGDPFETLRLEVARHGSYRLRLDRRESDYFYADQIVPPELAVAAVSNGGDFHTFDFRRVHDRADFELTLTPAASLRFGVDRFTKKGEATTTLDLQRDEFEFDRVLDESLNSYSAGFEYAWDKVTLVLEERVRDYENAVEIFLRGFSVGENATNNATLDFFFLDQPYDSTSYNHTARVIARPTERLRITAAAVLQQLELDVEADERSQGTGFNGQPFTTDLEGGGRIDRDVDLFDVEIAYRLTERLALTGGVSRRQLDQEGDLTFGGDLNFGSWEIDSTRAEAGLTADLNAQLTVAGGARFENRDVRHAAAQAGPVEVEEEETEHTGFFASAGWRPSRTLNLTLEAESSSYDDPFTLVAPTDRERFRAQLRWRLPEGFWLHGSYLLHRVENDDSGWQADSDQLSLRLGWRRDGLNVAGGFTRLELDRDIDQAVSFGGATPVLIPILYQAEADFFDGEVTWRAVDRCTLGAAARLYENDGSFALDRTDLRAWVDIELPQRYLLHLGLRTVDYDEEAADFDDYDADILEVGVGYRW